MNTSIVRLVATLLFASQLMPVGLPILCDQVRQAAPTSCEQQMPSAHHSAALVIASAATACTNSALCPTQVTAVPTFSAPVRMSAQMSAFVDSSIADFSPTDPQSPLPPPPEA
jgi:hypothetical protein